MIQKLYNAVALPQKYAHIHSPDLVKEVEESVGMAPARMLIIIMSLKKLLLCINSLCYEEIA